MYFYQINIHISNKEDMSFTRFHDDPARVIIQNRQATGPGRWTLDKPGNGSEPCYMADPQILAQQWAGNLWTQSVDIQSSLLGLDRDLNKDCLGINEYDKRARETLSNARPLQYPVCSSLTTEQSRVIAPAWTARDLEQVNWQPLLSNPQQHAIVNFTRDVSSRILEKEKFLRSNANNDCGSFNWGRQELSLPSQTEPTEKR